MLVTGEITLTYRIWFWIVSLDMMKGYTIKINTLILGAKK
jgi:hypothetical protein